MIEFTSSRSNIILVLVIVLPVLTWMMLTYGFYLNRIPNGLGVWRMEYIKTKSWGFGPGGSETGVVMFGLPHQTALEMQNKGISYFFDLPKKQGRSWFDGKWKETPIYDEVWLQEVKMERLEKAKPGLSGFLNRYGFWIKITPSVEDKINQAISQPGSFYDYTRSGGLIIVAPKIQKIFYVYAG